MSDWVKTLIAGVLLASAAYFSMLAVVWLTLPKSR